MSAAVKPVPRRPRIVTALGKQTSGKTLFLRWYVERAGRPMTLIDADPHNSTLSEHYPSATVVGSTGIEDRRIFLEDAIRHQLRADQEGISYDALWDVGGGDLLMARLARDVHFTDTLDKLGIDLTVFYVLSPSLSDLDYFQSLDDASFLPRRLGLIFNAGRIPGDRKASAAFDGMLQHPFIEKLIGRGAKPLFMPALAADCMEAVEKSEAKTFRDAIGKLDMWHEMRLTTWLDDRMEKALAKPLIELGWL
jgi:hypothetical protein